MDVSRLKRKRTVVRSSTTKLINDITDKRDSASIGGQQLVRRWRYRSTIADNFWRRWRKEYLLELRSAHLSKPTVSSGLQAGDLVLFKEDHLKRHLWKTGRITETFKGRDGLVRSCKLRLPGGAEKIAKLSNKEYLKGLAERIRADTVLPHSEYADVFSKDTSHGTLPIILSAPNGDVVAILASLNTLFGSMVMSEKRGIIYNNLINDFDIPGQKNIWGLSSPGHLNILAPRRRPVSSMAPVFVFRKGQFFAGALGTGGGYITSGIAQVLMRILWFRRPLKQAVEWYRVHHQLEPDTLFVEATVDAAVHSYLRQRSHQVELVHSWPGIVVAMLHDRNRTLAIYDYRDRNTANAVDGS
ncbi:scoloptoxin SSD20-like [Haemaphysalis longicornis]